MQVVPGFRRGCFGEAEKRKQPVSWCCASPFATVISHWLECAVFLACIVRVNRKGHGTGVVVRVPAEFKCGARLAVLTNHHVLRLRHWAADCTIELFKYEGSPCVVSAKLNPAALSVTSARVLNKTLLDSLHLDYSLCALDTASIPADALLKLAPLELADEQLAVGDSVHIAGFPGKKAADAAAALMQRVWEFFKPGHLQFSNGVSSRPSMILPLQTIRQARPNRGKQRTVEKLQATSEETVV